jgi:hypothetical protein
VSNSYLKKSIAAIIAFGAFGMSMQAGAIGGNNSTTNEFDEQHISGWLNPYDVASGAFDWTINDYNAWEVGVSDPEASLNGGGGESNPEDSSSCAELLLNKPSSCPNPIAMPSGASYARESFPAGSGLARLNYLSTNLPGASARAQSTVTSALTYHTALIANRTYPFEYINQGLITSVAQACDEQHADDAYARAFGGISMTDAERRCLQTLELLGRETGNSSFISWFLQWIGQNGIDSEDLGIPDTIRYVLAPENSLEIKYNITTANATCSAWWAAVETKHCRI